MWLPVFFSILLRIEQFILRLFFKLLRIRRPLRIPSIKNPLLKMSATALAKKIRDGQVSSQKVVEAYIERIKEVNPFLNAVIEDRFEVAINEAKICDSKLKSGEVVASKLETDKPLYGVPVTIKESLSLKGMSLTGGSLSWKGQKAEENGAVTQLVFDAGAIPLCVTNTPEFCSGINTMNMLYGTTVNPYDTRCSAGGSSGGEGALLAAGASPLGFGSDLVGSIRIPCHFNGIFGHKPSPHIISIEGHIPKSNDPLYKELLVMGPMSRYMDDIYTAMKFLTSKCEVPLRLDEPVNLKNVRVFYNDNMDNYMGMLKTKTEIRQTIHIATKYLEEICASVKRLPREWINYSYRFLFYIFATTTLPDVFNEPQTFLTEYIKGLFGLSENTLQMIFVKFLVNKKGMISNDEVKEISQFKETLYQKLIDLLGDDGVIIIPSLPIVTDYPEMIFFHTDCSCYTAFANVLKLPSTHVPMGLNKDGKPIGFQVIAATNQDRLCLAVAKELERNFGGWTPPS